MCLGLHEHNRAPRAEVCTAKLAATALLARYNQSIYKLVTFNSGQQVRILEEKETSKKEKIEL